MGLFDHFPYTNVHELNLDWLLTMMKALEAEWEQFTAGNSLTFADPLQHDISKTYAKNTIVIDGAGNAYVSLQPVPVGVALGNQDYWLMVFDYEAFIEKVNKNFTARYYRGQYRATTAMAAGDWLTVDDVLCKATTAIAIDDALEVGVNIEHFTLEDFIKAFMQSANQLIQQYKNDIDASELLYRQQLAQDIANTTATLQAQLDAAISGATVDSEVILARVGIDGVTYPTLGDAIRGQLGKVDGFIYGLLADNTDLDTMVTNGTWILASGYNYPNKPSNLGLPSMLTVSKLQSSYIMQTLVDCYNGKRWVRRQSSGTWSDWQFNGGSIPLLDAGSDLDNVVYNAPYLLATGYSYINLPPNLELPAILYTERYSGTTIIVQTILDYSNARLYTRRRSGGTWNNWSSFIDNKINKFIKFDFASIGEDYDPTGYYANGSLVVDSDHASMIISRPYVNYIARYYSPSVAKLEFLDASKNYVKDVPYFTQTFTVKDITGVVTKTIIFYKMERQYPYVNIVYDRGINPPVYGTDRIMPAVFADDDYSSFEYTFVNDSLVGATQESRIKAVFDGVYNLTGEVEAYNFHTAPMVLKKGTIIDTRFSSVNFKVCGSSATSYYFTDRLQHYEIKEDMIAAIQYYPAGATLKWPAFNTQIPSKQFKKFIRIITPEDKESNCWNGKNWWCFGTSISDIGPFDNNGHNDHSGKYPLYLDAVSGMKRFNGAIGSGGFTDEQPANRYVTANVLTTPYDADLATIEILPNDNFRNPAKLGDITDTTPATICGALTTCLNYLTSKTRARVVVIFITWRFTDFAGNNDNSYVNPVEQPNHVLYREAVDKLKKVCELFGVSYIDANANALEWGKRRVDMTYRDMIHPNYLGGEYFGEYIWNKLRDIKPYDADIFADDWTYTTSGLTNGTVANPNNVNAVTTDYIPITKDHTAYVKVNQDVIGDDAFYIYGYMTYDSSLAGLTYKDYDATTTLPTVRVTDDDAAYIRFTICARTSAVNVIPLRSTDFTTGDVVVGVSAD